MRHQHVLRIHHEADPAGDEIAHRRRRRAIGHARELDVLELGQQHLAEIGRAAGTGGAAVHGAGMGSQIGDEALVVGGRHRGVHREHERHEAEMADRLERRRRVERDLREELGDDRMRHARDEEIVTVRRGAGDQLRGDRRSGARLVLDQHRLAESAGHVLGQDARDDVDRAPGAVGDDDPHRLVGIGVLCAGEPGKPRGRRSGQAQPQEILSGVLADVHGVAPRTGVTAPIIQQH